MTSVSFSENKLFHGLPEDLQIRFAPTPQVFQPGEVIFREGDLAECLFMISSGTVLISKKGRAGQQESLAYFESGDFFGEMGLFANDVRSARATAVGRVVVGCMDRGPFTELLRAAPTVLVTNLLSESVSRLRDTDSRLIKEMLESERMSLIGSMLSTIIHDIRGPLSIITGSADLLSGEEDFARRQKYSRMLRRSVSRISDMVQELLDFSKGTTRLSTTQVVPREIINEIEEEVIPTLAAPHLEFVTRVDYHEPLDIDRNRFFRVLQNIIKNAAESMPDGGTLSVVIEPAEEGAVFRISDTGVGIPPEILPTIFEPFVTYGKSGGTGLGMAIAKSVVEAHNGEIRVESIRGEGTCFTIRLPASNAPRADIL